jgi:hypothetical protein
MLSQGTIWAGGGIMMFGMYRDCLFFVNVVSNMCSSKWIPGLTKGAYNIFTGFMSMTPYDMVAPILFGKYHLNVCVRACIRSLILFALCVVGIRVITALLQDSVLLV